MISPLKINAMNYYSSHYVKMLKFSYFSKKEVQGLLTQFLQNTQPQALKFEPSVVSYNDVLIQYKLSSQCGIQGIDTDLLMKNINRSRDIIMKEITYQEWSIPKPFEMKFGKIRYQDKEWLCVPLSCAIIRVDSINKLIPGGMKQVIKTEFAIGNTNGRILILAQLTPKSRLIDLVYDEIMKPYGFQIKRDFVRGVSYKYPAYDTWKPIEWAITPWLESVISPMGNFVRFRDEKQIIKS